MQRSISEAQVGAGCTGKYLDYLHAGRNGDIIAV